MVRSSKCMVSGVLVATFCAGVANPVGAQPTRGPRPPAPSRIDTRDTRLSAIPDTRAGGRFALVSQSPLTTEIAGLAISGDGRLIVAADRNGALALVDAETGEVRSARSLVPQPAHEISVEIDGAGRKALVLLRSRDPNVPHEIYAWDLVTDDLARVMTSRSPTLAATNLALAASSGEMLYVESPAGATGADAPAGIVRADGRMRNLRRLAGGDRRVESVGFTPGLGLPFVVEGEGDQPVHIYAGSGEVRVEARPLEGPNRRSAIAFRPTGGQLGVIEGDGRLALCSPLDGRCADRVQWQGHSPTVVSYGLGGDCIELVDASGAQALVDARTGEIVANLSPARRAEFVRGACTEALIPAPGGRLERIAIARAATSLGRADAAPVPGLDPRDANAPISHTAVDASGRHVVLVAGRSIVIHDVESGQSRARTLVGTPGVVTDVVWSRDGDQLFVRRDGEVLRAGTDALDVVPCEGDGAGRMLPDGSLAFAGALGCAVRSSHGPADLQGQELVATNADGSMRIAASTQGFARFAGGAATPIWPAADIGCAPGDACRPSAIMSGDGAYAALRAGGKLRVVELASGRRIADLDARNDASIAFTYDRQSLLVAVPAAGLDAVDLRTGQVRHIADGSVLLGGGNEVSGYVVLGASGRPFVIHDARTHRPMTLAGSDRDFDATGTIAPLRPGLFVLTAPHRTFIIDVENRRAIPIDGTLLDAVRVGPAVTAAVCRDETMQVLSMAGGAAPRRVGQVSGCSRIRRAALRHDGGAVAVAAGDAAIVVETPGDRPPLLLRSQQDREGRAHAVSWVIGRGFSADDAVVDQIRLRRAGQLQSATIDAAASDSLRAPNVHGDYFRRPAPAPAAQPAEPAEPGRPARPARPARRRR